MAQMNRNVNLEEINSDALFGVEALKNQTIFQKIIFFGCVLAGVVLNVCLPIFYDTSRLVCILSFLGLIMIGVAFGCNYTEDMTYGKYLYFFFFKPSKELVYRSTEDVEWIRKQAIEINKEEELALKRQRQANPEEQRKLLIKVVAFILIMVIAVGGMLIYSSSKSNEIIHHTVESAER